LSFIDPFNICSFVLNTKTMCINWKEINKSSALKTKQ